MDFLNMKEIGQGAIESLKYHLNYDGRPSKIEGRATTNKFGDIVMQFKVYNDKTDDIIMMEFGKDSNYAWKADKNL